MQEINTVEVSIIPNRIEKVEAEGDMYLITEAFKCTIKEEGRDKYIYLVKKGFKTNFRSGPEFLDLYIPKIGKLEIAISWLIHDVNYRGYLGSRERADELLFQMLEVANIDPVKNETIYIGLRLFGWWPYEESSPTEFVEFYRPSISTLIDTKDILIKKEEALSKDLEIVIDDMVEDIDAKELVFDTTNRKIVEQELKRMAKRSGISIKKEDIDKYYK